MLSILIIFLIHILLLLSIFTFLYLTQRDAISPLVIIPFFSFFYIPGWIYHQMYVNSYLSYQDIYILFIALLFIISFTVGGYGKKRYIVNDKSILNLQKIKITAYVLFFISLFLFIKIFFKEGILFFISGKGIRTLMYANMGFEKFAKDLMIPAAILFNYYYTKTQNINNFMFKIIMIFIIILFVLLEVRSGLAMIVFSFLYFYNRHIKKIKNIDIFIIVLFLLFMGSIAKELFYNLRLYISQGQFRPDIIKAIHHTFIQHEFYAWFEIFKTLFNEFLGGETFYKSLKSFFIPHFLGGDYYSPATWYVETYLPEKAAEGYGRGFSFIAEIYLNFSTVGVLIFGYSFGKVLRTIEDSKYYFIAMFFTANFPFVWTGNSAILLKQYFAIYFLPAFLIYQTLKFLPVKQKYARI